MTEWQKILDDWRIMFNITILKPVNSEIFEKWKSKNDWMNQDISEFYKICNGISWDGGRVLPLFDNDNSKKTWDSLQRANDFNLGKNVHDELFLMQYYIIGEFAAGGFFAVDKKKLSFWFEEEGFLHETDAEMKDFLELVIRDSM